MRRRCTTIAACVSAGVLAAGIATFVPASHASAQGLFESLFGGLRRAVSAPPSAVREFTDPFTSLYNHLNRPPERALETASGPAKAFCVRTCDGSFFPVRAQAGLSAAQACRAFCPASETRLYSGGNIDYAVGVDGRRYADLPNAFVYRKQLVAGCTCNGRSAFGLARIDVANDPTLRPGDVVATTGGMLAFTGSRDETAAFTPAASYRGLTQSERARLSETKIMPPSPGASPETTASIPRTDGSRNAQLDR